MISPPGIFVISLDFELYWGVRDKVSLEHYGANILGEQRVVPALLEAFERRAIHATWATVGLLFFRTREELLAALPARRPAYSNPRLSPYPHIQTIGASEESDKYHFGRSLLERVRATPHQEIASHTFSHYYCLERGQTPDDFRDDLRAAVRAAASMGVTLRSLVFPRNQCHEDYLGVCREEGFVAYRGNPRSWMFAGRADENESTLRRAMRVADAYLSLTGHNTHALDTIRGPVPVNVPASRFLRPFVPALAAAETARLRRILADMDDAARRGRLYHLWWHPHNFGVHIERNLAFLDAVLNHFVRLRERHGMRSLTMGEVADLALAGKLVEADGDGR
jgi:peptidoglycan/xylan/chitin deacetylase (PgdA/CDA1 family)